MEDMTIFEKLVAIQSELKAPKSQYNSFGKYNYRNCEDILEAFKPLGLKYKAAITISDEIVLIGDRYYVKATAKIIDAVSAVGEYIENTAYAREEAEKKGMDSSQVTGSTSSYARKYALNGLFAIDDTKDSDTTNTGDNDGKKGGKATKKFEPITEKELSEVWGVTDVQKTISWYEKQLGIPFSEWDEESCEAVRNVLKEQKEKREGK